MSRKDYSVYYDKDCHKDRKCPSFKPSQIGTNIVLFFNLIWIRAYGASSKLIQGELNLRTTYYQHYYARMRDRLHSALKLGLFTEVDFVKLIYCSWY